MTRTLLNMLLTALAIHRPGVAVAGIVATVLCGCMPVARGETFSLTVDSKSNIYASGLASTAGIGPNGPGTLPRS